MRQVSQLIGIRKLHSSRLHSQGDGLAKGGQTPEVYHTETFRSIWIKLGSLFAVCCFYNSFKCKS